jgi:hypothetical protein
MLLPHVCIHSSHLITVRLRCRLAVFMACVYHLKVFFQDACAVDICHILSQRLCTRCASMSQQHVPTPDRTVQAIKGKMSRYRNPWLELKIQYGANKGKAYTEEEDRFLLCMMHKLGYGAWDEMKAEIRKSWRFRFDWFFKSRTPQELNRRCDTLIRLVEKENEEADLKKGSARKSEGGGKKRKVSDNAAPPASKKVK